ncbi:hypothetical protein C0993_001462, partial [Termitomyces sp. T159_Od127]
PSLHRSLTREKLFNNSVISCRLKWIGCTCVTMLTMPHLIFPPKAADFVWRIGLERSTNEYMSLRPSERNWSVSWMKIDHLLVIQIYRPPC